MIAVSVLPASTFTTGQLVGWWLLCLTLAACFGGGVVVAFRDIQRSRHRRQDARRRAERRSQRSARDYTYDTDIHFGRSDLLDPPDQEKRR